MDLVRGTRDRVEKYIRISDDFEVCLLLDGNHEYDFRCLIVDEGEKVIDNRFMISNQQKRSPQNAVLFDRSGNMAKFVVNLPNVPANAYKIVFLASIIGSGTMNEISKISAALRQSNQALVSLRLEGRDFDKEKSVVVIELYRKQGEWRFNAIARGLNTGLTDLLMNYGVNEQIFYTDITNKMNQVNPQLRQTTEVKPVQKIEKICLTKGQKITLTKNEKKAPIIIENGWTADGKDYDLKALVRYRNGTLIYVGAANDDEVLSTPDGAVRHGGDITVPGELEHIYVKWHPNIASVAVSSYSAMENGEGSFYRYGVFVRIKNGNQTIEIPASDVSANDLSYTLCFGEILFGQEKDSMEVVALEMYSAPTSENRIGYRNGKVMMDIGPSGQLKS